MKQFDEMYMVTPVAERVRKHRERLRAKGLRPIQIWVPDTRTKEFAEEARRQSLIVAEADAADKELQAFMDANFADLGETLD